MASRTSAPPAPSLNGSTPEGTRFSDSSTAAPVGAGGAPPKLRRRPMVIAAAIAVICAGGAGGAWVATSVGDTQAVLALRDGVNRGEVITAEDLVVARINADPALSTVPESALDSVVGQRAAVDLAAGSILTPDSTTTELIPAAGQALVGVPVTAAQIPASQLVPGDEIRIVATPRDQDDAPASDPTSYPAVVVSVVSTLETGQTVIDVTVPAGQADDLAAVVATGRIAVVLDAGGGQ